MPLKKGSLRYQRVKTCQECGMCTSNSCKPVKQELRSYSGLKATSDGFDCALPVALDSHSVCSFGCLYCFSDNLHVHRINAARKVGQISLNQMESLFAGKGGSTMDIYRQALKYDRRNKEGYPCPIQLGALNDPMDNIERNQGWLLEFIKLAQKYNQPVRMSTKGILGKNPEYLDAFSKKPEIFWVAFSIITPDDRLLEAIDKRAPNASQRLEAMEALTDAGVNCSLRFRPIMPGISDSTPAHPRAYKDLIHYAAKAGARAVSAEVAFLSGRPTDDIRKRYKEISSILKKPLYQIYNRFGSKDACMRPPYQWTEPIMKAVQRETHREKMDLGISDPVWKQLTDFGCCCGIPPDDPVFGNWERENATNAMVRARDGEIKKIGPEHIIPPWADKAPQNLLCNMGAGPKVVWKVRHLTWKDKLLQIWNKPGHERSPLRYFQGAMRPVEQKKDGTIYYKYSPLPETKNPQAKFWTVI